jgi:hypothetical protein
MPLRCKFFRAGRKFQLKKKAAVTAAFSVPSRRLRSVAHSFADRDPVTATVNAMCHDCTARAGIVAAPVMTMMPVVTVAGTNRDAEIFRLCGSCGANNGKTQNGGSDCNVFHAYPPNASCWETKRLSAHSVPRFDFANCRRNAERSNALIFGPWKISPPSQEGRGLRAGSVP